MSGTIGTGGLNFYTAQPGLHSTTSPKEGTHDLSASFLGAGAGTNTNSSNYLRRNEGLQLVHPSVTVTQPGRAGYQPQTQTHQRLIHYDLGSEGAGPREMVQQEPARTQSKESLRQSHYSPMLFRRQNAEIQQQQ